MTNTDKSGGYAFPNGPCPAYTDDAEFGQRGMNMREYYKAKILGGFCANPAIFAPNANHGLGLVNCTDSDIAGYAGKLADEALAEDAAHNSTNQNE